MLDFFSAEQYVKYKLDSFKKAAERERLTDGAHKITVGMFGGRSRGADRGDIPRGPTP